MPDPTASSSSRGVRSPRREWIPGSPEVPEVAILIQQQKEKRDRKPWFKKKSGILLIIIAIALVILSYFGNEFESNLPLNILVMFIRSIVITILWFLLITPIATKFLQKYLNNKKSVHSIDLENIVELLPYMKAVVNYSWGCSKTAKGFSKIKTFFSYIFVIILNK